MPKTCITEQSARRQRWIEDGLIELMLHKPFDEITVTELCCSLSLPRRSFYRYFRDLPDVLDSLLEHTFQDMMVSPHPMRMEEFEANFRYWRDHQRILDALGRSRMVQKLHEYTARYTDVSTIRNYLRPGEKLEMSREASVFVITGFIALVIDWHADGFRKSPEDMARIAWKLLFSPILYIE